MRRGSGALLASILMIALLAPALPVAADTQAPEITNWGWDPKYPIDPATVRLFATITDDTQVTFAQATWCYVPPFLCLYEDMTNVGGGVYEVTVPTNQNAKGASLSIFAQDPSGNQKVTEKRYALFVTTINVAGDEEVLRAEPSGSFAVSGTAFYDANATAPAEGATVTVRVDGVPTQGSVDVAGRFAVDVAAPAAEGTFAVDVRVEDRTVWGQAEATVAVSTVPRPDLRIEDVRLSAEEPVAGRTLSVSFRVKNVGTAAATGARIVVDVLASGSPRRVLDTRTDVPPIGGNVLLVATWTPVAGPQSLRITADPDGDLDELNEANNVAELPLTVGAPEPEPVSPYLWIGIGGLGVAVAAGAVVMLRGRRRPPSDLDSKEGKAN